MEKILCNDADFLAWSREQDQKDLDGMMEDHELVSRWEDELDGRGVYGIKD